MSLSILTFIAVVLTGVMFSRKEPLLGFPCGIFWAILGGRAYQLSTATWDIYYLLGFACLLGMLPFTIYAAFALRKRDLSPKKGDYLSDGPYIDEGKGKESDMNRWSEPERESEGGDSEEMSSQRKGVRDRAAKRRTQGISRKPDYGEFR